MAGSKHVSVDTKTSKVTDPILNLIDVLLTLGNITIDSSGAVKTITLGSSLGVKVGATGDKIGFLGASPGIRPTGNVFTALSFLGLIASPSLTIADVTSLQSSLDLKAALASPALTGNPTAPTQSAGNTSTRLATTDFVATAVANLIAAAPGALDTLKELADAIGDDPNFATTVATSIATKLAKASNLSDLTNAATARTNLSLGNVDNVSDANKPVSTAQAAADAIISAALAAHAALTNNPHAVTKTQVGLGNASNTSDANKPVSTAQQAALDLKADLDGANTFSLLQTFNSLESASVLVSPLATPGAPTATAIGTDEGVTRPYRISALLSDGVETAAGPAGQTTHSDETLDATNKVSLAWTAIPGAASYNVWREENDGTAPATIGKIANVATNAYIDTGAAGDGGTPPAVNVTGRIRLGGPSPGDTPFPVTASVAAESFGAGPNKTGAQNRIAIQAAIDAMALPQNPAGRTGVITFNAEDDLKVYPITGTVYLYGGVTLDGGNTGVILAQQTSSAPATIQIGDDDNNSGIWSCIRNVSFIPDVVRDADTYEISLYNCTKVVVDHVDFKNVWGCLKVGRITGNQGMAWFNNIHAEGFENFAYTVRFIAAFFNEIIVDPKNDTANVFILHGGTEGCHFDHIESTGGGAKNIWIKALVHDAVTYIPRDNVWTNSNIDAAAIGVLHDNGDMNSFVNCWFSNRGNAVVQNGGANLVIALARIFDCDSTAIIINGGTDFSVIDTLIRDGGSHGVAIGTDYTGGGIIRGGHFYDNAGSNLFISNGVTGVLVNGTKLATPGVSNIVNGSPDGVPLINVYADGVLVRRDWLTPTLLNSWVYYGAPYATARYRKDTLGRVHVRFTLKSGTPNASNTALFVLPAGYRPAGTQVFACEGPTGYASVYVDGSGNVNLSIPGSSNTFLSGTFSFDTD